MDINELNRAVQKLNEAKQISEWHFRDAVEKLLDESRTIDYWDDEDQP